jgi:hypothetical protein
LGDLGRVEPIVLADDAGEDGDVEQMAIEDEAWERAQAQWEADEAVEPDPDRVRFRL